MESYETPLVERWSTVAALDTAGSVLLSVEAGLHGSWSNVVNGWLLNEVNIRAAALSRRTGAKVEVLTAALSRPGRSETAGRHAAPSPCPRYDLAILVHASSLESAGRLRSHSVLVDLAGWLQAVAGRTQVSLAHDVCRRDEAGPSARAYLLVNHCSDDDRTTLKAMWRWTRTRDCVAALVRRGDLRRYLTTHFTSPTVTSRPVMYRRTWTSDPTPAVPAQQRTPAVPAQQRTPAVPAQQRTPAVPAQRTPAAQAALRRPTPLVWPPYWRASGPAANPTPDASGRRSPVV